MQDIIIGAVFSAVLLLYPLWRIFARAGLNPVWSLLILIPGGAIIVPLILAYSRWPNTAPSR